MNDATGWFADIAHPEDDEQLQGRWQPCLETGTGIIPSFDMWFGTEDECLAYIRDSILPVAGKLSDQE